MTWDPQRGDRVYDLSTIYTHIKKPVYDPYVDNLFINFWKDGHESDRGQSPRSPTFYHIFPKWCMTYTITGILGCMTHIRILKYITIKCMT
jgi:hypothetical protein